MSCTLFALPLFVVPFLHSVLNLSLGPFFRYFVADNFDAKLHLYLKSRRRKEFRCCGQYLQTIHCNINRYFLLCFRISFDKQPNANIFR